jgi:hypothetical protein
VQIVSQKIEDILGSLRHLQVDWKDATAIHVIEKLQELPVKAAYSMAEVEALLDADFDEGILICRLFLGLSKDQFTAKLHAARGSAGIGVKAYRGRLSLGSFAHRLVGGHGAGSESPSTLERCVGGTLEKWAW